MTGDANGMVNTNAREESNVQSSLRVQKLGSLRIWEPPGYHSIWTIHSNKLNRPFLGVPMPKHPAMWDPLVPTAIPPCGGKDLTAPVAPSYLTGHHLAADFASAIVQCQGGHGHHARRRFFCTKLLDQIVVPQSGAMSPVPGCDRWRKQWTFDSVAVAASGDATAMQPVAAALQWAALHGWSVCPQQEVIMLAAVVDDFFNRGWNRQEDN